MITRDQINEVALILYGVSFEYIKDSTRLEIAKLIIAERQAKALETLAEKRF